MNERELSFSVKVENLQQLRAELEALRDVLQQLTPSTLGGGAAGAAAPFSPYPAGVIPSAGTGVRQSAGHDTARTIREATDRGLRATDPTLPNLAPNETPPLTPPHQTQHVTTQQPPVQDATLTLTQPVAMPGRIVPPQAQAPQAAPQAAPQPNQQPIQQPLASMPPTMQAGTFDPQAQTPMATPARGVGQPAMQIAGALAQAGLIPNIPLQMVNTAIQAGSQLASAFPALAGAAGAAGALGPLALAVLAAMAITPSLNAIGGNFMQGQTSLALTGYGGTTLTQTLFEPITSNPIYRALTYIPFFGRMIDTFMRDLQIYTESEEFQRFAARLTAQTPLSSVGLPIRTLSLFPFLGRNLARDMATQLQSSYYTAAELGAAGEYMLRGFEFGDADAATRQRGRFDITYRVTPPQLPQRDSQPRIEQQPSLLRAASRFEPSVDAPLSLTPTPPNPQLSGDMQIAFAGRPAPTDEPLVAFDERFRITRPMRNVLDITALLRQSPLFTHFDSRFLNEYLQQVQREVMSVVMSPDMLYLYGARAVQQPDIALLMLALRGDPTALALTPFQSARTGEPLRDIALGVLRDRYTMQRARIEQQSAQIGIASAMRFDTIESTYDAYMELLQPLSAERESLARLRNRYLELGSPELLQTTAFRQLEAELRQLALRTQEVVREMAQFGVTVVQTRTQLASTGAEYRTVLARRGTDTDVVTSTVAQAETSLRNVRQQQDALRALRSTVGELEQMQIDSQIYGLEMQAIAASRQYAVPQPSIEWTRERLITQTLLATANTTFATFANLRDLYGQLMRQTGRRMQQIERQRRALQERGLLTPEADLEILQTQMGLVQELAQYQSAYENRWLDRLVSQVWNAPQRMDIVAAEFTRREASLFYDILPYAFGGDAARARYLTETLPQMYRSLIGRLGTQEGFLETAMTAPMLGLQGELVVRIVVEDSGNRLIDTQQRHLTLNAQTRAFQEITVGVPTQ